MLKYKLNGPIVLGAGDGNERPDRLRSDGSFGEGTGMSGSSTFKLSSSSNDHCHAADGYRCTTTP